MRLELDGREVETVRLLWDAQFQAFQFTSLKLSRVLDTVLAQENRARVNGKDGHYTSDGLRQNGFGVVPDEAEFLLKLSLPPGMKRLVRHDLKSRSEEIRLGREIRPAFFSAYLNTDWTQDWAYSERFFSNDSSRMLWEKYAGVNSPEKEPLKVALDGAVRTLDWVVLGSGSIVEPENTWDTKAFTRKETRIVRDFPTLNSRLNLLDVSVVHDGGISSIPALGGIDFSMGNSIYAESQGPGSEIQFFLERPADVVLVVNNEDVKSFHLGSGAHLISGVVGRPGENHVELRVVYVDGSRQSIPFQFLQEASQIMPAGVRRATLGGGLRRLGENRYETDLKELVGTATYAQGLSPFWNGRAGLAVHQALVVANAGVLWVQDSASTWQINAAFSRDSGNRMGQNWTIQNCQRLGSASITSSAGFMQASFNSSFFSSPARQKIRYQLGLSGASQVWKGSLGVNANLQMNRRADSLSSPIDYSFGANYNVAAWKGLNLNAMGSCVIQGGELSPNISFTASYFFNVEGHSYYAMNQTFNQKKFNAPKFRQELINDTLRVGADKIVTQYDSTIMEPGSYVNEWSSLANAGWSWSEGMGLVGGKAVAVSGSYGFEQYGLRVGGQRTTNFADFSGSYSMTDQNQLGLVSRSHYVSTRMTSSLMFADGVFGLGRHVQDGFVLVKGAKTLSGTTFRINPSTQQNSEYSRGGSFLGGAYGLLSPYRSADIQVKPENPPAGTFLDEDRFFAKNTYKQGFVLELGKSPRVFVRLRLLDETDQALGYTTFQVFDASDTSHSLYQSFSSREGVIQIADLESGKKYILRFGEDSFIRDLVIIIPVGSPTMIDLGDKKIQHETFSQLAKLSMSAPDPAKKTQAVASTPVPVEESPLRGSTDQAPAQATPAPEALLPKAAY